VSDGDGDTLEFGIGMIPHCGHVRFNGDDLPGVRRVSVDSKVEGGTTTVTVEFVYNDEYCRLKHVDSERYSPKERFDDVDVEEGGDE